MYLEIHPESPDERKIKQVVKVLEAGGVIIYPTDTVYGLGCDIFDQAAVEKICRIRRLDPEKAMLSIICKDLSQVADYTSQIDNGTFRLMKRNLPGPFTFILGISNKLPKLFKNKKKTVGVRIPDNNIVLAIVEALGRPILTTSLKSDDELIEYFTNPSEIAEDFVNQVDLVIDGGIGRNIPSTIIDCTKADEPEVYRQGAGEIKW